MPLANSFIDHFVLSQRPLPLQISFVLRSRTRCGQLRCTTNMGESRPETVAVKF
jgi:hypothetical protein